MKIDSILTLSVNELSRQEWESLLTMLTFKDADWQEVQAYDVRKNGNQVVVPRGILAKIPSHVEITDLRVRPKAPKLAYMKELGAKGYEGQKEALAAMVEHEQGQIIAPPGKGKTEIGLAFAAQCRTPTLVVVHTKDLYRQWVDRTKVSVPGASLGEIRASHCQVGHITIAMAQTLKNYVGAGRKFWQQFGCIIVDESHHAAAETWEWLLNSCPAYFRFGLTATENRADGRHPLVRFLIGPTIYKMPFESQVPMTIQPVKTKFGQDRTVYRGPFDWSRMLRLLSEDGERNDLIAHRVLDEIEDGHTVLVLSRQIKHLEAIQQAIRARQGGDDEFTLVTGRMTGRVREKAIQGLRDGSLRCILATQLADEGLDVPRLDRVHLTFPGKHDGRIIQQIGRAIRRADDKEDAIINDYTDNHVGVLLRQADQRHATYRKLRIPIRRAVDHGSKEKQGGTLDHLISLARKGSPRRPRG
jgi:superfamily II DNA or RNA helicase